jgi:hypothetical protein
MEKWIITVTNTKNYETIFMIFGFHVFTKEELLKLFQRSDIGSKRDIISYFSSLTHFFFCIS